MKLLSAILLAGMAATFSALAAPGDIIELPPGVHPDNVTLSSDPAPAMPPKRAPVDWSKLPPASTNAGITFAKDIAPILKESCVRCHGSQRPKAGLRLDSLEGLMDGTENGPILKAGDSANSLLVKSVSQLDPKTAMPPKPRGPRGPRGLQGTNAPAVGQRLESVIHRYGETPGTNAIAMRERGEGREGAERGERGERNPGGPQGTNAPGQRPRNFGPPAKPLTADQVGLVRAWIDQGAK